MNYHSILHLFMQLTSRKPIYRNPPTIHVNETVGRLPVWAKYHGMNRINLLKESLKYEHKLEIINAMRYLPKGTKKVLYKGFNDAFSEYTFDRWRFWTSKARPTSKEVINSLHEKLNKGYASIGFDWGRIKEFTLEKAIHHSSTTDLRFILFLCLLYGFLIWAELVPTALLSHPLVAFSDHIKNIVYITRNMYENFVCSNHPDITSPCPCGERLNNIIREYMPMVDDRYTGKKKTYAFMITTIILTLALSETVSRQGIYLPLDVGI
uniref:Uncharacterized protein n=1 Tax=Sophora flavescens TaxID=49840 RepID=A0A4Y5UZ16_SOPFL|nr:hypothetical protein FPI08_mgp31 [Sophora flavescens]QDD68271.1 hypothetical protein [Sophora flavescens]